MDNHRYIVKNWILAVFTLPFFEFFSLEFKEIYEQSLMTYLAIYISRVFLIILPSLADYTILIFIHKKMLKRSESQKRIRIVTFSIHSIIMVSIAIFYSFYEIGFFNHSNFLMILFYIVILWLGVRYFEMEDFNSSQEKEMDIIDHLVE